MLLSSASKLLSDFLDQIEVSEPTVSTPEVEIAE